MKYIMFFIDIAKILLYIGITYFIFYLLVIVAISIFTFFVSKFVDLRIRRKQLTKVDFERDKEYYREILNEYSPLVLGYVDDFKINKAKFFSEILYMKYKNIMTANGLTTTLIKPGMVLTIPDIA